MARVWVGKQGCYDFKQIKEKLYDGFLKTGIINNVSSSHILVKPNLTAAFAPEEGKTTHPLIVKAVLEILMDSNVRKITLAESSQVGMDTNHAIKRCGYTQIAGKYGFTNLKETPVINIPVKGLILEKVSIYKLALEADIILSVAKLKTSFSSSISMCTKNMKGVIPDDEKKRFHRIGLNKAVADLNSVLPTVYGVIDGITGYSLTAPCHVGLLFCGDNPVSTDYVASLKIGISPQSGGHISWASLCGLGLINFDKISLSGYPFSKIKIKPFQVVSGLKDITKLYPIRIIDGNPCSGCIGSVELALKLLRKEGICLKNTIIASGPDIPEDQLEKNSVIVGNCARIFKSYGKYIPGCPCESVHIREAIKSNK